MSRKWLARSSACPCQDQSHCFHLPFFAFSEALTFYLLKDAYYIGVSIMLDGNTSNKIHSFGLLWNSHDWEDGYGSQEFLDNLLLSLPLLNPPKIVMGRGGPLPQLLKAAILAFSETILVGRIASVNHLLRAVLLFCFWEDLFLLIVHSQFFTWPKKILAWIDLSKQSAECKSAQKERKRVVSHHTSLGPQGVVFLTN